MNNIRLSIIVTSICAGTMACSSPPPDRAGVLEQHIDAIEDAGDAGTTTAPSDDPDAGSVLVALECAHPLCATGAGLATACDPCATLLCASDPYCCSDTWDATCVAEVTSICGKSCTAAPVDAGTGATCAHPVCAAGGALTSGCDSCATKLCAQDSYCCTVAWDATCVSEVAPICGQTCTK